MFTYKGSLHRREDARRPYRLARWGAMLLLPLIAACGTAPSVAVEAEILVATLQVAATTNSPRDLDGQVLSGSVTIVVQTNPSIAEVQVFLDDAGIPLVIEPTAPFEVRLDTTHLDDGMHVLAVHVAHGERGELREVARARFLVCNVEIAPLPEPAPHPAPAPEPGPQLEP